MCGDDVFEIDLWVWRGFKWQFYTPRSFRLLPSHQGKLGSHAQIHREHWYGDSFIHPRVYTLVRSGTVQCSIS